jgi:hypothetical protein
MPKLRNLKFIPCLNKENKKYYEKFLDEKDELSKFHFIGLKNNSFWKLGKVLLFYFFTGSKIEYDSFK